VQVFIELKLTLVYFMFKYGTLYNTYCFRVNTYRLLQRLLHCNKQERN